MNETGYYLHKVRVTMAAPGENASFLPPSLARARSLLVAFVAPSAAFLAFAASLASPRPAFADDAQPAPTVCSCVLKGSQPPAKGTQIFDAASNGRAIADFSGAMVPLQISEIPFDPTTGRAKIQTANGSPTVRIEGWAAPSSFTVYSVKDVPVAAGHVWIADGQKVKLAKTTASAITAEITIEGSQSQVAKG